MALPPYLFHRGVQVFHRVQITYNLHFLSRRTHSSLSANAQIQYKKINRNLLYKAHFEIKHLHNWYFEKSLSGRGTSCQKVFYHKNSIQKKNKEDDQTESIKLESIPFGMETNQTKTIIVKSKQESDKYSQMTSSSKLQALKDGLIHVIGLVEEVTHMDDIRKAQANVMNIKDKLKASGDHKRQILTDLNSIRDEMQKLHSDMRLVNRGSEHHIQLLDQELEYLKKEKQKQDEFHVVDELERNLFNNLTIAINDSYEKEKIHTNSVRVWGYIQTVVVSFFTLLISIIGYYYHNNKFGLLAKRFEENVNNTMKSEIGTLREDIIYQLEEQEVRLLKKLLEKEKDNGQTESWGGYFKRHGVGIYRYFWPKKE